MAVTINGNGTITGIAVGGLPDGIVDNGTMADDAVAIADLAATGTASSTTFLRGDNSWQAAGGAWSVKSSGTASAVSSVIITGLTKTTKFYFSNVIYSSTSRNTAMQLSDDNGSTWKTSYDGTHTGFDQYALDLHATNRSSMICIPNGGSAANSTDSGFFEFLLPDPSSTSTKIQFMNMGAQNNTGDGYHSFFQMAGRHDAVGAINAIKFFPDSGTFNCSYVVTELN